MPEAVLSHNCWQASDGQIIRVRGKGILIRADKPKTMTQGGLHIPDTAVESVLNTGTILAYGFLERGGKNKHPYVKIPIPDLHVGQRCVFVRYLAEVHTNKQMQERLEENVFRIDPSDVLLVFGPEEEQARIS